MIRPDFASIRQIMHPLIADVIRAQSPQSLRLGAVFTLNVWEDLGEHFIVSGEMN